MSSVWTVSQKTLEGPVISAGTGHTGYAGQLLIPSLEGAEVTSEERGAEI